MTQVEEIGVLLLGLAAVGMGLRTIRRREEVAIDEIGTVIATYRGPAALCQGISVVLAGLGIVIFATARLLGLGPSIEHHVRDRPGLLILFVSLACLAWSLSLVFGSIEQRGSSWRLVASLPGRLLGVSLGVLSAAGLGLGLWEIAAPGAFDHLVRSLSATFLPGQSPR
jgi:hypothetical protein